MIKKERKPNVKRVSYLVLEMGTILNYKKNRKNGSNYGVNKYKSGERRIEATAASRYIIMRRNARVIWRNVNTIKLKLSYIEYDVHPISMFSRYRQQQQLQILKTHFTVKRYDTSIIIICNLLQIVYLQLMISLLCKPARFKIDGRVIAISFVCQLPRQNKLVFVLLYTVLIRKTL